MTDPLPSDVARTLDELRGARVVVLSGAGISAESGIPTFRGKEGYWTVGAREYHPMEMATQAAFSVMPREVWGWYLYRRGVCRGAAPNAGHDALARLEGGIGDRFRLVTQNVDGLHLRVGNTLERCYQVHGNIDYMRCARRCSSRLVPVPDSFDGWTRGRELTDDEAERLVCPDCGGPARPHVLWFDEYYEEELFRSQSSLAAATEADLLLVVGTSGSTNIPMQIGAIVARADGVIIDVNPDDNPFGELARHVGRGHCLRGPSSAFLPAVVDALVAS